MSTERHCSYRGAIVELQEGANYPLCLMSDHVYASQRRELLEPAPGTPTGWCDQTQCIFHKYLHNELDASFMAASGANPWDYRTPSISRDTWLSIARLHGAMDYSLSDEERKDIRRRQEEQSRREEEESRERQRRNRVREERKSSGKCTMCGSKLGLLSRLMHRDRHSECTEFSE